MAWKYFNEWKENVKHSLERRAVGLGNGYCETRLTLPKLRDGQGYGYAELAFGLGWLILRQQL